MPENEYQSIETITHSKKQYLESPELETIAKIVIEKYTIELGPAEIGYFLVYPNISKKRPAKAVKAGALDNFYSGNHYFLQVSGELWDMLDQKTKEIMVYHQLLHFEPVFKSKTQEWTFKIRKPEYTDYYTIADKLGSEWHKTVQATMSSLYDLDPRQETQISLF